MEALLRELWQLREIQELAQLMESGGGPALVTGLSPVHRAMTAAALRLKSGRPLLMLCADEGEARRQAADLRSLTGREPVLLAGREAAVEVEDISRAVQRDARRYDGGFTMY